jgi:hypothetical protein
MNEFKKGMRGDEFKKGMRGDEFKKGMRGDEFKKGMRGDEFKKGMRGDEREWLAHNESSIIPKWSRVTEYIIIIQSSCDYLLNMSD